MATMKRGSNVALTREIPGLSAITVGVHWDAGPEQALSESLVVATLLCDEHSKALSEQHFVFFNQLISPDESVSQAAQALGADNEQIEIDLAAVPGDIARIVVALYINEGLGLRRTLGQLRTCEVRVLNAQDRKELVRSENLAPAMAGENAVILAEVYRHLGDWKFKVIGEGYAKGVAGILSDYGLRL